MSDIGAHRTRGSRRTGDQRDVDPTTLTVWFYDSPMGATAGLARLRSVAPTDLILVLDAVTMTWIQGTHAPRVGRLRRISAGPVRTSALGAFATFLLRTGADEVDALAPQLGAPGLDREFLQEMKDRLAPGRSALLVLSADTDLDAIRRVIERGRARGEITLMHASLPGGAFATFSVEGHAGTSSRTDPAGPDRPLWVTRPGVDTT